MVIKFAARVNLHHLELFLAGRLTETATPQDAIRVLDIVLRELPSARFVSCGVIHLSVPEFCLMK